VKKSNLIIVAAFLAGVILAGRARSLPLLNKLPSI
jgi:hypothetical protein